jgi:HK97 family phage portal protein
MIKDVLIQGNGYAYIHRSKDGVPETLEYLPMGECQVYYDPLTYQVYYRIPRLSNGVVEAVNVVHLLMHSANGIIGKGILDFARKEIELAKYAEKASIDYFANGMSVQGILKQTNNNIPINKQKRDQIREKWNNADGSIRILEAGMDYQQVQSNSREAELIQNRTFTVQEIGRFFNISPVLLGDLSKMAYNSIEASQLEFVVHTLTPYVIMLEQEINKKLIMPDDRTKYYIDIDEQSIIKSDRQSHANYLSTLVSNGILTINEARTELGLPDIEGGDKNIIPYTDLAQNTVQESDNETFTSTENNNTNKNEEE